MNEKEMYMKRAIEIAKTAEGHTSPNPMVGCVIVKDGRIISEACHERYGEYHAERNALLRCSEDPEGAELYVTLEPCCHYGKTPPCTDIIIDKKIKKVYIGSLDSNPLVSGRGADILKRHGIDVYTGILEDECIRMNEIFFHYISEKMPFVALKYAMTIDGKIASHTGDSKWVTGEKTREHVHYLRKKYSSIMVGINTVIADNPMLNCRIEEGVNPVRVILDTNLVIPIDSDIVQTAGDIRTIVAFNGEAAEKKNGKDYENYIAKKSKLKNMGVELADIRCGSRVDIKALLKKLGEMNIDSVLVEGGGEVNASVLETGLVNKVYAYIAPKIIMGREAKTPIQGRGIDMMKDAVRLKDISISPMGEEDILLEGYVM